MAAIRKRRGPEGRTVWQAQIIRVGHKPLYRTFDRRGDAEAWARRTEADLQSGDWVDRSEGDRTLLRDALERYKQEIVRHKQPATQQREIQRIERLKVSSIGPVALTRLTGRDIATYIREREAEGLGGNALRREIAIVSHLFTVARGPWGMSYLVNPVPAARLALPPVPKGRTRRLLHDEEDRLMRAAPRDFGKIITFALATAMRRGEIASLRWENINLNRKVALLPHTKNHESRSVPLSPAAVKVLKKLAPKKEGKVFEMKSNTLSQNMTETCTRAGIADLTFHDLRHEAITRFFETTDLDVMEIKMISGHKTFQMLARYTHLRADKLAARMAGQPRAKRG